MHVVPQAMEATAADRCAGSPQRFSAGSRGLTGLRMFEGVEPMGRGRAKAKQVKVARQLKYNSGGTDLDRLRTELGVGRTDRRGDGGVRRRRPHGDRYSDYADGEETDEDDE